MVRIVNPTSASPTALVFTDDHVYKIWVNYRAINPIYEDRQKGQVNEALVYNEIKSRILDTHPNYPFLRYIEGSNSCRISVLEEKLNLSSYELRQLVDVFLDKSPNALWETINVYGLIRHTLSVGYIKTPLVEHITFKQLLASIKSPRDTSHLSDRRLYLQMLPVAFSFLITCWGIRAMRRNNIVHNDLHFENVMIVTQNNMHIPVIYDFDRAYAAPYTNQYIQTRHQQMAGIENKIMDYPTDIFRLLWYMTNHRRVVINGRYWSTCKNPYDLFAVLGLAPNETDELISILDRYNQFLMRSNHDQSIIFQEDHPDTQRILQLVGNFIYSGDITHRVESLAVKITRFFDPSEKEYQYAQDILDTWSRITGYNLARSPLNNPPQPPVEPPLDDLLPPLPYEEVNPIEPDLPPELSLPDPISSSLLDDDIYATVPTMESADDDIYATAPTYQSRGRRNVFRAPSMSVSPDDYKESRGRRNVFRAPSMSLTPDDDYVFGQTDAFNFGSEDDYEYDKLNGTDDYTNFVNDSQSVELNYKNMEPYETDVSVIFYYDKGTEEVIEH